MLQEGALWTREKMLEKDTHLGKSEDATGKIAHIDKREDASGIIHTYR
jgi:hypothetical protein